MSANTATGFLALAFDTLILGLTLKKTGQLAWTSRSLGFKRAVSYVIVRDGTHASPVLDTGC